MNILIFGASGFIGHACFLYFSKNHVVSGVDVQNLNCPEILVDLDFSKSLELIKSRQFDSIINCAGSSNIQNSFINPKLDYELNTLFVEKILFVIKEHSPHTKFINLSSAAVYGNPKHLPIKESDISDPLSPYGKHKLISENIIEQTYRLNGIKGLSLRIFSAYGAGLKRQFFYDLSKKMLENKNQVMLIGTGNESRDFIYIDDITYAIECVLLNAEFKGQVVNLAGGEEVYIKNAAFAYAKIFDYEGQIEFSKEQFKGYPLNWKADISKIKSYGFSPRISLEKGMHFYSEWIKLNFAI